MAVSDIIYYSIYITCLLLSFKATSKNLLGLGILRALLIIGLLNEIACATRSALHVNNQLTNFIYIPCEYIFLCFFYLKQTKKDWLKLSIKASMFIYLAISFYYSVFYYHFNMYPSIIYNASCFLSIIWATLIIFDLETLKDVPATSLPAFWIVTGIIIFYSGVFTYNAVYNYFRYSNYKMSEQLRIYINVPLNNILYLSWIYAFVCSIKMKKYSYR